MNISIIIFVFIFFLTGLNLNAGEIITWTDKDGNLNISNLPPPHGVHINESIRYREKADNHGTKRKYTEKQNLQHRLKYQKNEDAEKAAKEAKKAELEAIEARNKANKYINRHAPRKKRKREGFRYRRKKAVEAAQKAEAYEKQAEKKASEAKIIEKEIQYQTP